MLATVETQRASPKSVARIVASTVRPSGQPKVGVIPAYGQSLNKKPTLIQNYKPQSLRESKTFPNQATLSKSQHKNLELKSKNSKSATEVVGRASFVKSSNSSEVGVPSISGSLSPLQSPTDTSPLNANENASDINIDNSAQATIDDFKDRTDPTYVGPGTWDLMHKKAFKVWSKQAQEDFCEFVRQICYDFNCSVCRGHCTEYIEKNPPEEYIGVKVMVDGKALPLALFAWTWKFHNAVNSRLGKPLMSWDTAYSIYSTNEIKACSSKCHGAGGDESHKQKTADIEEVPAQIKPFVTIGRRI